MKNFNVNYHASVCIDNNIYIDPLNIDTETHNAKAILLTHSHWDHLSIIDIKKIANEKTFFIAPKDCIDKLKNNGFNLEDKKNYYVADGESNNNSDAMGLHIPNTDIWVQAFPSYNINKQFHLKTNLWVGFVITVNNVRYVVCGDSDFTPELASIKCDVLFVPIGGTYTMDAKEAAECTNIIKPKLVVPCHYLLKMQNGIILGSRHDEKVFLENLEKSIKYKLPY